MPRVLLRAAKDPWVALSPEATLARNVVGSNSGNLLFGDAVHHVLSVPGTEVVANGYLTERDTSRADAAAIDERFDAFVIPLANAFRPSFMGSLRRLTRVIERLHIPVVVVGVGSQHSAEAHGLPTEIQADVTAFVRAVLDHGPSIGVRGEITAAGLAALGFGDEHVDVIGCPSLFRPGRDHRVSRRVDALTPDSPIAANLTLTKPRSALIARHNLRRYPRLSYVAQEVGELALGLWGEPHERATDDRLPLRLDDPVFTEDRWRYFIDPGPWVEFMAGQHFAFGSRIHGNIAALLAGTPAYVLAFDSRTRELADYHAIPWTPLGKTDAHVDAADLHDRADPAAFNAAHPDRFDRYLAFLERHGLRHIWGPDGADPAVAARIAAAALPGPVRSPLAAPPEVLLERLRWLRQGATADARRADGAHVPAVTPRRSSAAHQADPDQLAARVERLEAQLAETRRELQLGVRARVRRRLTKIRRRR